MKHAMALSSATVSVLFDIRNVLIKLFVSFAHSFERTTKYFFIIFTLMITKKSNKKENTFNELFSF